MPIRSAFIAHYPSRFRFLLFDVVAVVAVVVAVVAVVVVVVGFQRQRGGGGWVRPLFKNRFTGSKPNQLP